MASLRTGLKPAQNTGSNTTKFYWYLDTMVKKPADVCTTASGPMLPDLNSWHL